MNTQNTQECKVKPTTGPWSVFGCTVYQDDCWNAGHNEGGTRICSTYSGSPEEERDEMPTDTQSANAQFIVRSCNAHEELLCACRMTLAIFKEYEEAHECINYVDAERIMRKCQDAITKAEAHT